MEQDIKALTSLKQADLVVAVAEQHGNSHPLVWFLFCEEQDSEGALKVLYLALGIEREDHELFSQEFAGIYTRALQEALDTAQKG